MNAQTVDIWYIPRKKGIFSKPDDILTAAEKYIEENGPEEFEKLISKVCILIPTKALVLWCLCFAYG